LKRSHTDNQQQNPQPVDARFAAQLGGRRDLPQPCHCDRPKGQVQDEDPTPRGEVGDDAAEQRTHDRAGHDRRSPYRQHAAVLSLGVDVEEDCLCQWLDDAGGGALGHAELDQCGWRWRNRAEQRGDNKERNCAGEGLPCSKAPAEPSGQRGHHGGGAEIARHDPGAEIESAAQTLLELRQRNVCDCAVEGLHGGGNYQRHGCLSSARGRENGGFDGHPVLSHEPFTYLTGVGSDALLRPSDRSLAVCRIRRGPRRLRSQVWAG